MDYYIFYVIVVTLSVTLHIQINPEAAVGTDCTTGGNSKCTMNERCNADTNLCECDSDSYQNPSGTDCLLKSTDGGSCAETSQCQDGLECNGTPSGTCGCATGNYFDGSTCVLKKAYGEDCGVSILCQDGLQCSGSPSKCNCQNDEYYDGSGCVSKSEHGGTCTDSNQCQDGLFCYNTKCGCQNGTYYSGSNCVSSTPALVPNITGITSTYNSFTVTWTRIPDPTGYPSTYALVYNGNEMSIDGGSSPQTTQSATGLDSNKVYNVTMKRYINYNGDDQGVLESTPTYQIKTKSSHNEPCTSSDDCAKLTSQDLICGGQNSVCLCPDRYYYNGVLPCLSSDTGLKPRITGNTPTYNSFRIQWTKPTDPSGYSSRYTLEYNPGSSVDINDASPTQSIQGLSPNTPYQVTIKRYISFGGREQSPIPSDTSTVTTSKSGHREPCSSDTSCESGLKCYSSSFCVCPDDNYYTDHCVSMNGLIPDFSLSSDLTSITLTLTNKPGAGPLYTSTYAARLDQGTIIPDITDSTHFPGLTEGTVYRVTVLRSITLIGVGRVQTTEPTFQDDSTKVAYNNTCASKGTCIDVNANCYETRCVCNPRHYWFVENTECKQISELAPGSVGVNTPATKNVTVSWTPPPNSGYVSGYRVDATPTDHSDPDPPAVEVSGGAMTSRTLTGLQPGTQYTFTVESKSTNEGREEYVPGTNNATSVTKPAPILSLDEVNSNFSAPDMKIAFQPAQQKFISYTVTLRGETDGYNQQVTATGSTEGYFNAVFRGVITGNFYNITVVTNSVENSQSDPFIKTRQRVMAEQASEVVDLTTGPLTSKSVVVSWKRPRKPNGRLFEYSLEISQDDVCKSRIVFNCTQCSRNSSLFVDTDTSCPSPTMIGITENDINDKNHVVVHNVTALDPDTSYTIQAVAYNEEGRGRGQTPLQVHTNSEPARAPTSVTTHDITSNTVTVSWVPESPRPGHTSYVVEVLERNEDNEFSLMKNLTVWGYSINTLAVQGLSSYWKYKFQVNSQSEVPPASVFVSTGVITTSESAPTEVVNLEANAIPDVYDKVRLSWQCPPQKDGRNGVIQTATVRYEPETLIEDVTPKTGEISYDVTETCSWDVETDVTPGFNYTYAVFISNSFAGASRVIKRYMPEGPPSLNKGNKSLMHVVSGSVSESNIAVDLCTQCLFNNQNGVIIRTGLLVCRLGHCPIRGPSTKQASYYDNLPNWDKAKGVAFTSMYRATADDWMKGVQPSESERFVLGDEDCSSVEDQTSFCNGPLPKDTYRMWLFACTSVGCGEGSHLEFTLKETVSDTSLTASTVGAVVASSLVVVVVIILVVVYIKVIRPRSKTQRRSQYVSNTPPNDDTYEDIAGGNRLNVIQEVDYYNTKDSPPRSENTYDQLTVYSNEGHHVYGRIKDTQT